MTEQNFRRAHFLEFVAVRVTRDVFAAAALAVVAALAMQAQGRLQRQRQHRPPDDVDVAGPAVKTAGTPTAEKWVLITHYGIDETHSNAYTIWKAMGAPQHPFTEQYATLQAQDSLQLLTSPKWMDGRWSGATVHHNAARDHFTDRVEV